MPKKLTRALMIASAVITALLGIGCSFAPQEVLTAAGVTATKELALFMQLAAAPYLGFAMLNWMARGVLIGGIYARPVSMGNFLHYFVGSAALLQAHVWQGGQPVLIGLSLLYPLFAVGFGLVVFIHPLPVATPRR